MAAVVIRTTTTTTAVRAKAMRSAVGRCFTHGYFRFLGRVEINTEPQLGQGFILKPGSLSHRKPQSGFGQAMGRP
jgi:hypothetical protein